MNRLLLFDVDSTLINEEVIELIAAHAGVEREVKEITDRAMAGEIDFEESLRKRVALLKGLPVSVLADVQAKVTLTNGASELVANLFKDQDKVAVVSGGFIEVITPLMQNLGIQHFKANKLEVEDGFLTGKVEGEVIDRLAKARFLNQLKAKLSPTLTIAIGDGANDIDMIEAADVGIAFCAKEALNKVADIVISKRDLREVLEYI